MSERKVLNKYYPPDFDPSKIPRAKCSKNRQFNVRLMAPCNMKCLTCGEYIAKAKKFNARKEDVENMDYIGLRIYRFYIKCPGCLSEISFRTNPETTDYVIEAGAHRNFQALRLAEEQADRQEKEEKEEIESNPMLLLENRTQQSQYEMEVLESLEDLKELNDRHAGIDIETITQKFEKERQLTAEQKKEQERKEAMFALGYELMDDGSFLKRLPDEDQSNSSSKRFKIDNELKPKKLNKDKGKKFNLSNLVKFNKTTITQKTELKDKTPDSVKSDKDSSANIPVKCDTVSSANIPVKFDKKSSATIPVKCNNDSSANIPVKCDRDSSDDIAVNCDKNSANSEVKSSLLYISERKSVPSASTGLSLLGSYSESEDSDEE